MTGTNFGQCFHYCSSIANHTIVLSSWILWIMKRHSGDDFLLPYSVCDFSWEELNGWGWLEFLRARIIWRLHSHAWHLGWDDQETLFALIMDWSTNMLPLLLTWILTPKWLSFEKETSQKTRVYFKVCIGLTLKVMTITCILFYWGQVSHKPTKIQRELDFASMRE